MANKATARARAMIRFDPLPRPCWPKGNSRTNRPKDGTAATAPCCAYWNLNEAIYRLRAFGAETLNFPFTPRRNTNFAKLRA